MIEIENLSFRYDSYSDDEIKELVLKNINLSVADGEFVAIIGHNGSGKSTLSKLLNGILVPSEGDIFISGMNTKDEDLIWEIRKSLGMVFQNPENQIITSLVEEEIAFGPENIGLPREEIEKRISYALEAVGMTRYRHHAPHLLSGGQKQRIAIAGILAMNPQGIILDEPTAMLDPIGRREVIDTVYRLNKEENKTILLITHNMEETIRADRILVMNDGEIFLEGSPRFVFSHVNELKEIGLDVPQVTELSQLLYRDKILDSHDILSIEELVEKLC